MGTSVPDELDGLAEALLFCEKWGVLSRTMVWEPIPLDTEWRMFGFPTEKKPPEVMPPRLIYVCGEYSELFHCIGDDQFYVDHPEYEKGGLSAECHIVTAMPAYLANYTAMANMYCKAGMVPDDVDRLGMEYKNAVRRLREKQNAVAKK